MGDSMNHSGIEQNANQHHKYIQMEWNGIELNGNTVWKLIDRK